MASTQGIGNGLGWMAPSRARWEFGRIRECYLTYVDSRVCHVVHSLAHRLPPVFLGLEAVCTCSVLGMGHTH